MIPSQRNLQLNFYWTPGSWQDFWMARMTSANGLVSRISESEGIWVLMSLTFLSTCIWGCQWLSATWKRSIFVFVNYNKQRIIMVHSWRLSSSKMIYSLWQHKQFLYRKKYPVLVHPVLALKPNYYFYSQHQFKKRRNRRNRWIKITSLEHSWDVENDKWEMIKMILKII